MGYATISAVRSVDILRQMDVLRISAGNIRENGIEADYELTMSDPDKNSLPAALNIFGQLALLGLRGQEGR